MGSQSSGDDEVSSLLRRSHISTVYDHDLRFDNRNSEDVHKDALAKALAEHERIRVLALRAYQLNEAREAQERLRLHTLQEEERVRILTERAEEECRLREIENKARQIPKPAPLIPRAPTPPPVEEPKPPPPPVQEPPQQTAPPAAAQQQQTQPITQQNTFQTNQQPPQPPLPPQITNSPQLQQQVAPPVQAPRPTQSTPRSHLLPGIERYIAIHENLKDFRKKFKDIQESNKAYKTQSGNMRRKLRMALGQLTFGQDNDRQVNFSFG
jgi:nucleoporin GLE1